MLVQLAYPYPLEDPQYWPDEIVELSDDDGRQLLQSGRARPVPQHPVAVVDSEAAGVAAPDVLTEANTVEEIRARADELGVDLGGARRKVDMLAAIEAATTPEVAGVIPDEALDTDEPEEG